MACNVHASRRYRLRNPKHKYFPEKPLPHLFLPISDLPLLSISYLTGSRATFLYAFRQMGKPFRDHGRKFHARCICRISPHMGNHSGSIPQSRSSSIQCPEHLVLGMQS